ncbi:hypothetical protein [Acinetobacter chinensis]|uniref:hypothetical protein n=1 Tax=Acinetobacter chinensis TaxID=2004650 RepID=UPI0029348817|nr:hypothetical protein [Acinetobacter chinensis]WOE43247.1 hypothetical protein QSG87_08395 [Acinetobacter chinensis]
MKIKILALSILFLTTLSACQSEYESTGKHSETATFTEQVSKMEDAGELPRLDRTDTVAGIDADDNGIRDDIDVYIGRIYTSEEQQKAASQFAKTLQASLLVNKEDKIAVKAASIANTKAITCIFDKFPNGEASNNESVVQYILGITTNTKIRLLEYVAFDKALDGTVISIPNGEVCDE